MKIFISYARADYEAVKSLAADLSLAHQDVWLDDNLTGGSAWWPEILTQIRACTVFVPALSDASLRSKPCRSELQYAQALGLPIVPVEIGPVSTYRTDSLFTRQLVGYREPSVSSAMILISALYEQGLQRAELPIPLPQPPPIPYEYLLQLGAALRDGARLTEAEQKLTFHQLSGALDSEDDDGVREEIINLLDIMAARPEICDSVGTQIQAIRGFSPRTETAGATPEAQPHQNPEAPALADAAPPSVTHLRAESGRCYLLQAVSTRIGRNSDNDIVLDSSGVNPHHAVIIDTGISFSAVARANYIITDLQSSTGVYVQDKRIRSSATLNDGDSVAIGEHRFSFHIGAAGS